MTARVFKNLREKRRSTEAKGSPDPALESLVQKEFLDETPFLNVLRIERRRTERSGRRFILMLLECTTLVKSGPNQRLLEGVFQGLLNSTREVDIKGWYKEGHVMGVIFTEIGSVEGKSVVSSLLNRVSGALCDSLTLEELNEIRLSFHVFPEDKHGSGNPVDLYLYPDLKVVDTSRKLSCMIKRCIDFSASLVGLILLAPVLAVISVAVKLTSKGPILFRQQRVGQFGGRFTFLKFRSMYAANDSSIHREYVQKFIAGGAGCEQKEGAQGKIYKLTNDPRVTPVGRFLRRTSLDELPQLFNVLAGSMSLVGPRPPVPYEFECYDIWHKRRILSVKPGITGLWQVGGRSTTKFDEMVRLDLRYANTWSLWLDIKILLLTPRAVFSGNGAY